jgi:hypothetical protein
LASQNGLDDETHGLQTKRALTVAIFFFMLAETGETDTLPLITIPAQQGACHADQPGVHTPCRSEGWKGSVEAVGTHSCMKCLYDLTLKRQTITPNHTLLHGHSGLSPHTCAPTYGRT